MQYCYLKYCKLNLSLLGMYYLRGRILPEFEQLLNYFDATHVTGTSRSIRRQAASGGVLRLIIRRIPRCSHRAAGTCTTQPSSGKTGRTTCVKRGTGDSRSSSATTTHPSGHSSTHFAKRPSRPRPPASKTHSASFQKSE